MQWLERAINDYRQFINKYKSNPRLASQEGALRSQTYTARAPRFHIRQEEILKMSRYINKAKTLIRNKLLPKFNPRYKLNHRNSGLIGFIDVGSMEFQRQPPEVPPQLRTK